MSEENTQSTIIYEMIFLVACCIGLIALGIHIQIPDQLYCDSVFEYKHAGATVYYIESMRPHDYSFNQSKCMYNEDGEFIANPKYSIWGIRI